MKIDEIEKTKGSKGNYYGIEEVLGSEIEIREDISSNTDIREHKTKKENTYYCILINHIEEKDIHLTKAAFLAVAKALPRQESWKGYKIRINRTGHEVTTQYIVTVVGKSLEKALEVPGSSQVDKIKSVLDNITLYGKTMPVTDQVLEMIAAVHTGSQPNAVFMIGMLKASGKIGNTGAGWVVT